MNSPEIHPMKSIRSALIALLACCAWLSPPLYADDNKVPIIQGKDVTREKLLGALAPPAEEKTRDISKVPVPGSSPQTPSGGVGLLITFIVNSAKLTESAKSLLDIVADVLQNERLKDKPIVIEGHADPTGNNDLNFKLSQARAESVVQYLATRGNVRRNRLTAQGKGARNLYNKDVPSAPENRRVVIVVMP